jgi:hypothetical protein
VARWRAPQASCGPDYPGRTRPVFLTDRSEPRLEATMVALDVIVGVLVGSMPGRREQLVQHGRVHRRVIGDDLRRHDLRGTDGLLEEPASGCRIPLHGDEDVDDLTELVDRAVDIPPSAGDLHVGLVDLPVVPDGVSAGPGGVGQQWCEPLHPAVDGDVVDLDAALGEQLLNIAVGQAEAQVPAHCQHDHVGWEAEAGEGRSRGESRARAAGSHSDSLSPRTRCPQMQQCPRARRTTCRPDDWEGRATRSSRWADP